MTTRYLTTDQNGNGDQTYWDINGYFLHGPSGEKLNLGGGNTTVTASNEIVQIGTSYIRVPQGVSNERPNPSYAGMIRYLTSENLIEYYNSNTGSWLPISQQPPEILSFSPQYVSDNCGGSPVTDSSINIVGDRFGTISPLVQFIGTEGSIYNGITTLTVPNTQCNTLVPQSVFDNSNQSPFTIKLTNNETSLTTTSTQELFVQNAPFFTTNAFLGSFLQNTPPNGALDLSAIDPEGLDLSFSSIDLNSNTSGQLDISFNGVIDGFIPTLSFGSQNIPFIAKVEDTSGGFDQKTFNFDVLASYSITTTGSPDISYIEYLNGVGDNSSNPYTQGSIVYIYKSDGTFQSNYFDISDVEYLVVAGGGGGGSGLGSGGGAGGFLTGYIDLASNIQYSITVGNGGNGGVATDQSNPNNGTSGTNSELSGSGLSTITAVGGGYGAGIGSTTNGGSGGSGGGGGWIDASGGTGTLGQGNNGGSNGPFNPNSSGGGGASQPGEFGYSAQGVSTGSGSVNTVIRTGGKGGDGALSYITGQAVYYAGGGGGARYTAINGAGPGAQGGLGGGGQGGGNGIAAQDASANSGSGGGGGDYLPTRLPGGNGGSGIVILRIPYTSLPRPNPNYLNIISNLNNIKVGLGYIDRSSNTLVSVPTINTDTFYIFTNTDPDVSGTLVFEPLQTITDISFIIVAGGGGGGGSAGVGAGGGAGGVIVNTSGFTFTQQNYTILVGGGGRGGTGGCGTGGTIAGPDPDPGINGNNSSITASNLSLVAIGGGGGGSKAGGSGQGNIGGSGGGSDRSNTDASSNQTSPTNTIGYGNSGGTGSSDADLPTGGGGGAGAVGGNGLVINSSGKAGNGGIGITTTIITTTIANNYEVGEVSSGNVYFGGGGGGSIYKTIGSNPTQGIGGLGGGGTGGTAPFPTLNPTLKPTNARPHTGGGGGGTGFQNISSQNGYTRAYEGGNGGSGIIILRFPSFA